MTIWMLCAGLLLAVSASPLAVSSCYERGYPMSLRIAVGTGLIAIASAFPSADHWMTGLLMIGLVGIAPIVVDALLDRSPADLPAPSGAGCFDHDGGMGATCAALAATTAISSF